MILQCRCGWLFSACSIFEIQVRSELVSGKIRWRLVDKLLPGIDILIGNDLVAEALSQSISYSSCTESEEIHDRHDKRLSTVNVDTSHDCVGEITCQA